MQSSWIWLSTVEGSGVTRLEQTVSLEETQPHNTEPEFTRAYELGLEKFFQYTGTATGAGSSAQVNLHNGNLLWTYAPISNPSIGPSTFVRLTYSSLDGTSSQAGYGFSLQASTLTRNGSPLIYSQPKGLVSLIDGDGTSQVWRKNAAGVFEPPAGVHLALRPLSGDSQRAWVFTRPDGTKFYFDSDGYQSEVRDPNGNSLTFSYDLGTPKRLRELTDATARPTLNLAYDAAGRVQTITDISGRTMTFGYDTAGKLVTLTDAATGVNSKVFEFKYSTDSTNTNIRLSEVRDPQRPAYQHTNFSYIESTTDSWANGRLKSITDRRGKVTNFGYADVNGATVDGMQATVTDANQHTTTYTIDDYGRPSTATNAKNHKTTLTWDGDNNVSRLTEPNGALTTWAYDWTTGYPLSITDAEQNRLSIPKASTLNYTKTVDADGATIAHLRQKTSPAGDSWAFDYDSRGNLIAVTDPNGTATSTDPDDYKTTYLYDDAQGLLLRTVDANGHATVYSKVDANNQIVVDYHPSGSPNTITDAYGNETLFSYDPRGNVHRVEDARHAVTTQTYDGFGRPRVATVPIDTANNVYATSTTTYDLNDNVIETIAPNDAVTTNVYDAGDLLVESRLPRPATMTEQRRVTNTYDPVGNLLTTIDPVGNAAPGRPAGHVTSYGYDELDQVASVTDGKGGVTGYSYDTVGNLIKVVDAVKSATPDTEDYTTKYGYDLSRRRTTVTDAAGHNSRTRYDADGQVTRTVDAAGNITDYSYDQRGQVTEVRTPYDVGGPGADYHTTGFGYDQVGNRTEVIKPRGMATSLAGDFTEVTEYDALNRPVRRQQPYNPDSAADPVYKTPANVFYTYDEVGRLTAMSNPTDTATKWWTRYTHFDNGWVKSSTDPFGIRTDYGYDRTGQQTARTVTSAAGTAKREMTWDYDLDGSLKSRGDAAAPAGVSEVLSDNSDQRETTPVGTWPTASSGTGTGFWGYNYQTHARGTGTNTFSWDLVVPTTGTYEVKVRYPDGYPGAASNAQFTVGHAAGSTTKSVDQRTGGGTWVSLGSYAFAEGVGKSVKLSDAADGVVLADAVMLVRNDTTVERARRDLAYVYDLNGNLTTVDNTKAGASDYTVGYDELNRPTQVTETTGSNTATTVSTYDPVGRPDTVTIDQVAPLKDQFYDYTWDVRGLLAQVRTGVTASDPAMKTTSYSYENRGLRAMETKGNRNKVAFTWFDNGLMASSREFKPDGKSLVAEHLLSYDADGNRVRDAARVLNSDTKALDPSTATYAYEPRGRVTSVDRTGAGASDESYTYSASSNITTQTIDATATSFVYDRDRLQKSTVSNAGGSVSSYHNHDPFGRLDTVTSGGTVVGRYVYDGFDRIVEQRTGTGAAVKTTRSTFDAWDRVATKTDANGKTTAMSYLGLSSQLLAELDTSSNKQKQSYTFDAHGQRLTQTSEKADGTTEDAWYGYTPRGDVETLTTAAGETKSTYGYTAYGKDRAGAMTGADKPGVSTEPYNLYRFGAKRWDSASGDYDMGFRIYNPGLNRFTSRDMYNGALADLSLGTDPWNTNRYTFGGGNPISRVELDGHVNECLSCGGAGGDASVLAEIQSEPNSTGTTPTVDTHGVAALDRDSPYDSPVEALQEKVRDRPRPSVTDTVHSLLDSCGLVPLVGEPCDAVNAGWYAAEGDSGTQHSAAPPSCRSAAKSPPLVRSASALTTAQTQAGRHSSTTPTKRG